MTAGSLPVPVERVGLKDVYPESRDPEALHDKYGLSVMDIVEAARNAIMRKRTR